jgi:hypothetical protein
VESATAYRGVSNNRRVIHYAEGGADPSSPKSKSMTPGEK